MDHPPPYSPRATHFNNRDFETASIRSAAPSYVSTVPNPAPLSGGLPSSRSPSVPSLEAFRNPTWSRTHTANPTARAYHNIAHRRASALKMLEHSTLLTAAINGEDAISQMKKKMDEEERQRSIRSNEDPYLVGEEAAEQKRQERLKRENGYEMLEREDKRWDWLLAQMSDWEERDKSWKKFRAEVEGGKRGKLAKRLGIGR